MVSPPASVVAVVYRLKVGEAVSTLSPGLRKADQSLVISSLLPLERTICSGAMPVYAASSAMSAPPPGSGYRLYWTCSPSARETRGDGRYGLSLLLSFISRSTGTPVRALNAARDSPGT